VRLISCYIQTPNGITLPFRLQALVEGCYRTVARARFCGAALRLWPSVRVCALWRCNQQERAITITSTRAHMQLPAFVEQDPPFNSHPHRNNHAACNRARGVVSDWEHQRLVREGHACTSRMRHRHGLRCSLMPQGRPPPVLNLKYSVSIRYY